MMRNNIFCFACRAPPNTVKTRNMTVAFQMNILRSCRKSCIEFADFKFSLLFFFAILDLRVYWKVEMGSYNNKAPSVHIPHKHLLGICSILFAT